MAGEKETQSDIDKALAAMQKEIGDTEEDNPTDAPGSTHTESSTESGLEKNEAEPENEEETEKDDQASDDEDPENGATETSPEKTEAEPENEEEAEIDDSTGDDETAEPEQEEADTDTEAAEKVEMDDQGTDDEAAESNIEDESEVQKTEDKDDNEFVGLDDENPENETGATETEIEHETEEKTATSDSIGEDEAVEATMNAEKSEAVPPEKPVESMAKKPAKKQKNVKPAKGKAPGKKKKAAVSKPQKGAKSSQKPAGSHRIIKIAALIAGLAAVVLYTNPAILKSAILKLGMETNKPVAKQIETPVVQLKIPPQERKPTQPIDSHRTKLAEAKSLRQELLMKKEDIKHLNEHYRSGIANLEYDILEEMRRRGITSFSQAQNNKKIELNLRTIQRRQAYTQLLKKPVELIDRGSEELLYLSRKAIFDLQIIPIASGVDMDRHMRYLNAVIQKYQLSADKLTIDVTNADFQTIEAIWERIYNQKEQVYATRENAHNQSIWKEICAGDLGRVGEMSRLSAEAAACLSEIKGADLFLNGIADLSANAAENLVHWEGNWICLNGFKTLSPAIATHLFQWQGNWLSLNGLSEFPSELAKLLTHWKGRQLELMGLKYQENNPERIGLKGLAQWEKSGGKLYVPEKIRKEIGKIM